MTRSRIFVILILAATALAASGGEEAAAAQHVDWLGVLGKVINSAILFGGLAWFLRKPLIKMLADKSDAVRTDFDLRQKNLAETSVRLEDIEQRLKKVKDDVAQIKAGAETGGREELARLEAAGREEAARIIALSEEEIRLRVDAAVRSVRSRIADLAIERFKADFVKNLDATMQQKIIERNISACGGLGGNARPGEDSDEGK
jgi:F0F1-type ATP synthase membrane subunit b/b'